MLWVTMLGQTQSLLSWPRSQSKSFIVIYRAFIKKFLTPYMASTTNDKLLILKQNLCRDDYVVRYMCSSVERHAPCSQVLYMCRETPL